MKLLTLLLFAVLLAVKCPVHPNGVVTLTGKTSGSGGVLSQEYRCSFGHTFWVPVQ